MQFRQQFDMPLKRSWFLPALVLSALIYGPAARPDAPPSGVVTVSPANLAGWQPKSFARETLYRVEQGGRGPALHAIANGSASGLCRYEQIDLGSLPIVRWSWRLDRAPPRTDERGPAGDDQGLRLSFVFAASPETLVSIQYVWSQNEPPDATWPNAFVPNVREVVARSGPPAPGTWNEERRDLKADFRAAFGGEVDRVHAVCIMTDGDQTGALVEGWYGDITFQPR